MASGLEIRLELSSSTPAWRQIAGQLRTLIIEDALPPGTSLPPVRRLAIDLGIHFNTVAEAFRALANEGLVEIVHGHGARVMDRGSPPSATPEMTRDFRMNLRELIASARARGLTPRSVAAELRCIADAVENL
jgi:GntR family transcriptional regulator